MTIHIGWYDRSPGGRAKGLPNVFLAGPTTDARPSGRAAVRDFASGRISEIAKGCADLEQLGALEMSEWRAELTARLMALGWAGVLWVPEFRDKGRGEGWFERKARSAFGERAGAILTWEEDLMASVDVVAAWAELYAKQPGLGLNARPEIYGLLLRSQARGKVPGMWAPKALALGIPVTSKAVGRHRMEAQRAGVDALYTLSELAEEIVALTEPLKNGGGGSLLGYLDPREIQALDEKADRLLARRHRT